MSSKIEFVEYVAEQCRGAGEITYKKMFGEYGLYCNGKIFALVCDDQFFVKIADEVKALYPKLPEKPLLFDKENTKSKISRKKP